MLQALLKGKLSREQKNMEDILTSNVFGLLKYVQPQEGMLKYLALAEDTDGKKPLEYFSSLSEISQESIKYEFWPNWSLPNCEPCQPDLVIYGKKVVAVLLQKKMSARKRQINP